MTALPTWQEQLRALDPVVENLLGLWRPGGATDDEVQDMNRLALSILACGYLCHVYTDASRPVYEPLAVITGTSTVRFSGRVMRSVPVSSSGSLPRTASRTFWLCRSQSRAPRENSSYHGVSTAMREGRGAPGSVMTFASRYSCARRVVT